jgi:HlyD family secretion protein
MYPSIYLSIKICALSLAISLCTSCNEQEQTQVGYIDAEYIYIASNVPGTLHQLAVSRGQEVQKDELLFQLDPEPEASNVAASAANIKNLEAQVEFYKTQLDRQQYLLKEKATSRLSLEKAQIDYDSYVQQLAVTHAKFIETQWSLNQKTMVAPANGQVFDTFYQVGEQIPAYKPILSMLNPENLKVIFYLPEKELPKIKIGQNISFDCDGCSEKNHATISYISPMAEYTPPVIYNKDSRDKLVYLIQASLSAEVSKKFRPGQPIDIHVAHE